MKTPPQALIDRATEKVCLNALTVVGWNGGRLLSLHDGVVCKRRVAIMTVTQGKHQDF